MKKSIENLYFAYVLEKASFPLNADCNTDGLWHLDCQEDCQKYYEYWLATHNKNNEKFSS